MTDLVSPVELDVEPTWPRTAQTVAAGLLGGLTLGVAARGWMRLIAEEPEFTWSGTIFIVAGFMVFGLGQSIAAVGRRRLGRPWRLTVARAFGTVAMLPLFVAAGAVMLPTVIGGGLALARDDWRRRTRGICLVAAMPALLFVGTDLVDSFGWSLHSLAGFAGMLAVYGTIIWATQSTLAPRADGSRWPRWVRITVALALALLPIIAMGGAGG